MRPRLFVLCAMAVAMTNSSPAFSDTSASDLETVWECPQADGVSVYTNRERPGCRAMELTPISIVPSISDLPYRPQLLGSAGPPYEGPAQPEWNPAPASPIRNVPDWGKDWYAHIAPSGSTREEVCAMYAEWLRLNEKTRGGVFFGTDPSYGSDPSGRNLRGPSYSFYDNARWVTLAKLFGTGFVPVGCP